MTAPQKDKPTGKEVQQETKAKRERITQNGVVRPAPNTSTGKVWEHADAISAEMKAPAPRAKVLEACEKDGINPATAATQYGRWCKFNGVAKVKEAKKDTKNAKAAKESKKEPGNEEFEE